MNANRIEGAVTRVIQVNGEDMAHIVHRIGIKASMAAV